MNLKTRLILIEFANLTNSNAFPLLADPLGLKLSIFAFFKTKSLEVYLKFSILKEKKYLSFSQERSSH